MSLNKIHKPLKMIGWSIGKRESITKELVSLFDLACTAKCCHAPGLPRASWQSPLGIQLEGCSEAASGPAGWAASFASFVRDFKRSGRTCHCLFLKALFQYSREILKKTNKILMIISQAKNQPHNRNIMILRCAIPVVCLNYMVRWIQSKNTTIKYD